MKTWDGTTPYDARKPYSRESHLRVQGYRAAMNSPEVKALYEASTGLLGDRPPCHNGTMSCGGCDYCMLEKAAAAYEAGLKEQ